jgi:hypothetical protein
MVGCKSPISELPMLTDFECAMRPITEDEHFLPQREAIDQAPSTHPAI